MQACVFSCQTYHTFQFGTFWYQPTDLTEHLPDLNDPSVVQTPKNADKSKSEIDIIQKCILQR